jgi:NAD+ diphosphatase
LVTQQSFEFYLKCYYIIVNADAQRHSREDIKRVLTFAEYEKAQRTNAFKVNQICKGAEKGQSLSSDFKVESGEPAAMFFPGPFAIAHHLISSWAFEGAPKVPSSFSNLSMDPVV